MSKSPFDDKKTEESISEATRKAMEHYLKLKMASMEIEGFVFTEEEKKLFDKLTKGEISYDDIKILMLSVFAHRLEKVK